MTENDQTATFLIKTFHATQPHFGPVTMDAARPEQHSGEPMDPDEAIVLAMNRLKVIGVHLKTS